MGGRVAVVASCAGVAAALVACGSTPRLPEAASSGPLTASSVSVRQTGSAQAQVNGSSVSYQIDDSGSLVVTLSVTSTATSPETVAVRASLLDSSGRVIGDATGGSINLAPGASEQLKLNGPAPNGTIATAVFELTAESSPTPTAPTPAVSLPSPS